MTALHDLSLDEALNGTDDEEVVAPETRDHVDRLLGRLARIQAARSRDVESAALRRAQIDEWLADGGSSSPLLKRWSEILALPPQQIAAVLTERSEEAAWLRKASPFAGALDSRERERILRAVRQRFESAA